MINTASDTSTFKCHITLSLHHCLLHELQNSYDKGGIFDDDQVGYGAEALDFIAGCACGICT